LRLTDLRRMLGVYSLRSCAGICDRGLSFIKLLDGVARASVAA